MAILLCPLFRAIGWYAGVDEALVFRRFEMVADSLAFGCLLALDYERIRNSRLWRIFQPTVIVASSAALILIWSVIHRFWPAAEIAGRTFISLGALLIVACVAYFPESLPAVLAFLASAGVDRKNQLYAISLATNVPGSNAGCQQDAPPIPGRSDLRFPDIHRIVLSVRIAYTPLRPPHHESAGRTIGSSRTGCRSPENR